MVIWVRILDTIQLCPGTRYAVENPALISAVWWQCLSLVCTLRWLGKRLHHLLLCETVWEADFHNNCVRQLSTGCSLQEIYKSEERSEIVQQLACKSYIHSSFNLELRTYACWRISAAIFRLPSRSRKNMEERPTLCCAGHGVSQYSHVWALGA